MSSNRRKFSASLRVEELEQRELLAWTALGPAPETGWTNDDPPSPPMAVSGRVTALAYFYCARSFPYMRLRRCGPGSQARWRELPGGAVPMIDPRLLVTAQHLADRLGHLRHGGRSLLQQLREEGPDLRHGYTYSADPSATPTVTGLSASSGPSSGGTVLTLTGTNLAGTTRVLFGQAPAAFTLVSPTALSVTAPPGTVGVVDVTVLTPLGLSVTGAADQFTYQSAMPTVTGLSPSTDTTAGGTVIAIIGTNFASATRHRPVVNKSGLNRGGLPAVRSREVRWGNEAACSALQYAGKNHTPAAPGREGVRTLIGLECLRFSVRRATRQRRPEIFSEKRDTLAGRPLTAIPSPLYTTCTALHSYLNSTTTEQGLLPALKGCLVPGRSKGGGGWQW